MTGLLIVAIVIGLFMFGARIAESLLDNLGCAGFLLIVFMLLLCKACAG